MAVVSYVASGDVRVIVLDPVRVVDDLALQELYGEIVELLDDSVERRLLLDFGQVNFLSSAGLDMLIRLKKRCATERRPLALCNFVSSVAEVVRITGLDRVFDIHDTADEALAAFREATGGR